MACEVELDIDQFNERFGAAAMEAVQDAMSRRWRDLMEPRVPREHGPLRENVTIDGQEITYTENYANFVYNMDAQGTNWTIKGTGPHWNEVAKAESLDVLARYVGECILGGGE